MAAWVDLPSDLLSSISDRLDIATRLRLSAVCTSWASAIGPRLPSLPPFYPDQSIPWLLLSVDASKSNPNHTNFTFYDFISATSYCVPSPIPFPSLHHRWFGSSSGRIVFLNLYSQLNLISPLTGAHLLLPSIKLPAGCEGNTLHYWNTDLNVLNWESLKKVVLCRAPDHGSNGGTRFLALSLFWPHGVAVLEVGGKKWTWLDLEKRYKDAIIYQGKIYAIATHTLRCWEMRESSFIPGEVLTIRNSVFDVRPKYLVELGGKLMVVCRDRERGKQGHTMSVYELDFNQGGQVWNPVESIGDNALFLGRGYSRAVSTVGLDGIQGNCIYYVNDDSLYYKFLAKLNTCYYSGVHNLTTGTYEHYPVPDWPPPTWFWP